MLLAVGEGGVGRGGKRRAAWAVWAVWAAWAAWAAWATTVPHGSSFPCTAASGALTGGPRPPPAAVVSFLRAQFKTAVADVINTERHDDRYLLRFLRARKWDLAKAEEMFRNALAFRAKWKLDTILEDYKPPQVRGAGPPESRFFWRERGGGAHRLTIAAPDVRDCPFVRAAPAVPGGLFPMGVPGRR